MKKEHEEAAADIKEYEWRKLRRKQEEKKEKRRVSSKYCVKANLAASSLSRNVRPFGVTTPGGSLQQEPQRWYST